jgi:hypothetical protein
MKVHLDRKLEGMLAMLIRFRDGPPSQADPFRKLALLRGD